MYNKIFTAPIMVLFLSFQHSMISSAVAQVGDPVQKRAQQPVQQNDANAATEPTNIESRTSVAVPVPSTTLQDGASQPTATSNPANETADRATGVNPNAAAANSGLASPTQPKPTNQVASRTRKARTVRRRLKTEDSPAALTPDQGSPAAR